METVQGYVILKAAIFETGHGFALGHNPGAPSPFVTWQFTEGENGHRDYYWGRYGTSQAWAQRDFDRRVTTISSFTMRRSSIPSWDRRAFTAIIPPSDPWT